MSEKSTPKSFNSLQTGKYIQSTVPTHTVQIKEQFQFPSNGKVYPKSCNQIIKKTT